MRGDYESKVTLAKEVFKRMQDIRLPPELVPQMTQIIMDTNGLHKKGKGRTVLVIHDNENKKTEVYIDGETTS
jgi:hypothetical protein